MQTKRQSVVETLTGTFTGMLGSWLINMFCLVYFTDKYTIASAAVIGCTVWSLVRGYAIRRYFNRMGVPDA